MISGGFFSGLVELLLIKMAEIFLQDFKIVFDIWGQGVKINSK